MSNTHKVLPSDFFRVNVKTSQQKSFLIAFCGVDGSGKTSLINLVQNELGKLGILSTIFINHAGSTSSYWQSTMLSKRQLEQAGLPMQDDIDRVLQTTEFLAFARHILPSLLSQNRVVLSDGYDISKLTYARVKLDGQVGTAEKMLAVATDIKKPDLLFYLDISPETAMKRIHIRGNPEVWNENLAVITKAINYFNLFLEERKYSIKINAEKTLNELREEVVAIILSKIDS